METPIIPNILIRNFKPKLALQLFLPLILFTVITLQLSKNITSSSSSSSKKTLPTTYPKLTSIASLNTTTTNDDHDEAPNNHHKKLPPSVKKCDLFSGEWVRNMDGPYYTNESCEVILEHQNCMKYGRPDSEFMKWKWKPYECELPVFNPYQFLEIVKGKSLAFVGDSLARNQVQSLICLLTRADYSVDVSNTNDENFKRWRFNKYDFSVAVFSTPFLVKHQENDPNGPTGTGIHGLFLDEADEKWKTQIDEFDYVVISAGHWFFRSMMYYEKQSLVGCRFCEIPNVKDYPMTYGYRKAFHTAFQAILERKNFKGVVFLRTFSPSHFEGGEWNQGGNCVRQRPFKGSEINLQGIGLELYMAQLSEFKVAQKLGRKRGIRFRLLDVTQPILMRPDGHPSKYGHWPNENVTLYNDCVHWCLPGPIDTWNDFLLEMLRNEGVSAKEEDIVLHSLERKLKSKQ